MDDEATLTSDASNTTNTHSETAPNVVQEDIHNKSKMKYSHLIMMNTID